MWDQIRGHKAQLEMFRRAVAAGRLSQSYLLAGDPGIGKRRFAQTLAAGLMCPQATETLGACGECPSCKQVLADTHPDLLQVARPPGKSELPIELLAGTREKRGREGLCYDISLRPIVADRRIAIIADAETLNTASANTLLKTLEEPPAHAVFFLIVDRPESVLPTIRSRSQLVRFQPLREADVAELLVETDLVQDIDEARAIATLAGGSMDAAAQLADPAVRALREVVAGAVRGQGLQNPLALAGKVVATIEGTASDAATQRINAQWALRFLGESLRQALRTTAAGGGGVLELVSCSGVDATDIIAAMLERVIDSEAHLQQRMSLPLCMESLFDDLRRITSGQAAASA